MKTIVAALLLGATLCACSSAGKPESSTSPASTNPPQTSASVNSQSVATATECSTFIGKTITAADANAICTDGGTVYPAGSTTCTNGKVYLTFGPTAGGIVGSVGVKTSPTTALDRDTCAIH